VKVGFYKEDKRALRLRLKLRLSLRLRLRLSRVAVTKAYLYSNINVLFYWVKALFCELSSTLPLRFSAIIAFSFPQLYKYDGSKQEFQPAMFSSWALRTPVFMPLSSCPQGCTHGSRMWAINS
jgi:hypothetical protein